MELRLATGRPEVAESPAVKEFVGARELGFEFEIIFMDGRMQSCFLAADWTA